MARAWLLLLLTMGCTGGATAIEADAGGDGAGEASATTTGWGMCKPAKWRRVLANTSPFGRELYPAFDGFSLTTLDDHEVVLLGGADSLREATGGGAIFDVSTGTLRALPADLMPGVFNHRALPLGGGLIAVLGGETEGGDSMSAAVVDVPHQTTRVIAELPSPRTWSPPAFVLPGGAILVVGGQGLDPDAPLSGLFEPETKRWIVPAVPDELTFLQGASVTSAQLPDGHVIMAGSRDVACGQTYEFETATKSWVRIASMRHPFPPEQMMTLPDGRVLGIGRDDCTIPYGKTMHAALFDSKSRTWTTAHPVPFIKSEFTWFVRPDGCVMVVGGVDEKGSSIPEKHVLLYDPRVDDWYLPEDAADVWVGFQGRVATLPDGRTVLAFTEPAPPSIAVLE